MIMKPQIRKLENGEWVLRFNCKIPLNRTKYGYDVRRTLTWADSIYWLNIFYRAKLVCLPPFAK